MTTLKEQVEQAASEANKPQAFELTTLGGLRVFIHKMTAREIREWWMFITGEGTTGNQVPLWEKKLSEMFVRCCTDESGARLFTSKELDSNPIPGAALEEFFRECIRVNWLFITEEETVKERARFFTDRAALNRDNPGQSKSTTASSSSGNSPSTKESQTTKA